MNVPFACHPQWIDSVDIYLGKNWDEFELKLLQQWLVPGDVFIDVGANMGVYSTVAAASVGEKGLVLSVEASKAVAGMLREKWEVLGRDPSCILQVAVSDMTGTASFYESEADGYTGTQSLLRDVATVATREIEVAITTLDAIGKLTQSPPAALKIDIEGAESKALAGCPSTWLKSDGPLWIIEINPGALGSFAANAQEITDRFPADAFELWLLPKHPIPPSSDTGMRLWHPQETWTDSYYYNLIAIPRHPSLSRRREKLAKLLH